MLRSFSFYNPTKIYFGKDSLDNLKAELSNYGDTLLLTYGKNALKSMGLYDQVTDILKDAGKKMVELSGVMPNPTYTKLMEGVKLVKENNVKLYSAED